MAAFKQLGEWLNGTGWNTAITSAGIVSSDVTESLRFKASHFTRTSHVHQVTAVALYVLQWRAHASLLLTVLSFREQNASR